ncbi:FadR family transcriptional regulator [Phyllobacterium sp. 21LDTY02-6]|uniref:FadR/GntR family transcriptional regulator n=1 Tax=Phyllobacterium sp. 21LDTY02-6 TaxID=2944903 RepID=UPI00201FE555|nr:FadR/GntR family transcriptional regulator [Phyllobacterium sp. 21LDTY02-6]MCO4318157.1 FadR family transcriptional regulator [Phyllobacterium sp. 21LDTY02-6]
MPRHDLSNYDFRTAGQSHTQHGHVMRALGLNIVSGAYAENSILPGDAELFEQFGVSRTVLREALKTLAAKGLIQPRAKIGTRVLERSHWNLFDPDILVWHFEAGPTPEFLMSLLEMRLALEPEAAGLAALRRTAPQLDKLYHWVGKMAEAGQSVSNFVDSDLQFHMAIADASQNPFMRSISTLIEVALVTTFTISSPIPNAHRHDYTVARHRAIADAIRDGNVRAAKRSMRNVIDDGAVRVLATMPESTA